MTADVKTLAEEIYHQKTKQYFEEVISSYENENYRSAVVMLYTVVICDLVFKLNDLKDIHNDEKAKKILTDLEVDREENPVSPDWENNLIEKAFKEAKLLENDVYTHITTLKKYRNLSGHPVLNSLEILYRPNKELVESLMINMLNGLLNKHPLFSKNVFGPFMLEIERIKNDFPTEERLKVYLESKFLIHFNQELVEYIFKNLWKFVLKSDGDRENVNRDINYKVLLIIYERYEDILFDYIIKDPAFFSDFLDEHQGILKKLIDFLSKYPTIYFNLKQHTKELIIKRVQDNKSLLLKSYFLSESLSEHFTKLDKEYHTISYTYFNQPYALLHILKENEVEFLHIISAENDVMNDFYELLIKNHYHSSTFDTAIHTFGICIRPYFEEFNSEQMDLLLKEINYNPQCYDGNYGKSRNRVLLEKAKSLLGDDVEEKYPNVF